MVRGRRELFVADAEMLRAACRMRHRIGLAGRTARNMSDQPLQAAVDLAVGPPNGIPNARTSRTIGQIQCAVEDIAAGHVNDDANRGGTIGFYKKRLCAYLDAVSESRFARIRNPRPD